MLIITCSVLGYVFLPYISPKLYQSADANLHSCPPTGADDDPDIKREQGKYPSPSPSLKIVRFADTGEYIRRCERTDTYYELQAIPGPKLVIVYVHGWWHNATSDDAVRFSNLINEFSARERSRPDPRHVVGIYVAWNGTTGYRLLDYFTFWSRKSAADQISISGNVASFLGGISSIVRSNEVANEPSQIVFVGHSFGARILFSAINQHLIYTLTQAHPQTSGGTYKAVKGPADLVLLLNPALEASSYITFESVRRPKEKFAPYQKPVFVTISTDNDGATSYLFPLGQYIGMLRHPRDLSTIGNYQPYFTHRLLRNSRQIDSDTSGPGCLGSVCLVRTDDIQETNPFWIVTTGRDVLDNHGGIWALPFASWLRDFVDFTRPTTRQIN